MLRILFRLAGDGQRIAGHFAGRFVRKGQTAGPFRSVLDFREDETVDDLVHKFRVPVLGGAAGDLKVKGDGIAVSDRAALIAPHDQRAIPGQAVFQAVPGPDNETGRLRKAAPGSIPYLLLFFKCQISADDRGFDVVTVISKCQFHVAIGLEALVDRLPCK